MSVVSLIWLTNPNKGYIVVVVVVVVIIIIIMRYLTSYRTSAD